jgi:hypothetical protein
VYDRSQTVRIERAIRTSDGILVASRRVFIVHYPCVHGTGREQVVDVTRKRKQRERPLALNTVELLKVPHAPPSCAREAPSHNSLSRADLFVFVWTEPASDDAAYVDWSKTSCKPLNFAIRGSGGASVYQWICVLPTNRDDFVCAVV